MQVLQSPHTPESKWKTQPATLLKLAESDCLAMWMRLPLHQHTKHSRKSNDTLTDIARPGYSEKKRLKEVLMQEG